MDRLINAILKLSREGRRVLTRRSALDMAAMLRHLVDTMRHQAGVQGGAGRDRRRAAVMADRLAVEQVFGNVVENALKYLKPGRPGGSGSPAGCRGAGPVRDVGQRPRHRGADYERVFELFRRAGDQSVPGEGIGLAHVRALVRRLGGTIECASTLDVGTTFTIQLPAAPTTEESAA